MPITATKEFTFDCAHMLSDHEGLCKNLHGHTYKVQVTVRSKHTIQLEPSSVGMIVDFKDLKWLLNTQLFDSFDHAYIYNSNGGKVENDIAKVLHENNMKTFDLCTRPTAENMAKFFLDTIRELLAVMKKYDIAVTSVKVWETPTSFAEACI